MKTLLATLSALMLLASFPGQAAVGVDTVTFTGAAGETISGVIYRPASYSTGDGYSAVVMLHGCNGLWISGNSTATNPDGTPNLINHFEKWGLKLAEQGIVALAVDSFTLRKPAEADAVAWQNQCNGAQYDDAIAPFTTRVLDARAARDYLAATGKIDDTHIALMGWSQGGQIAMVEAAETHQDADTVRDVAYHLFNTTILFYPDCSAGLGFGAVPGSYWRPHRDVLMHVGSLDSTHFGCQSRANRAVTVYGAVEGSGRQVIFTSYADATHSFDSLSQTWPAAYCSTVPPSGNACAMNAADIDSLAYFKTRLVDNDGDAVWDADDAFPVDGTEWLDTDVDTVGNNADSDDDNDSVPDYLDPEPLNPANGSVWPLNGTYRGQRVHDSQASQSP